MAIRNAQKQPTQPGDSGDARSSCPFSETALSSSVISHLCSCREPIFNHVIRHTEPESIRVHHYQRFPPNLSVSSSPPRLVVILAVAVVQQSSSSLRFRVTFAPLSTTRLSSLVALLALVVPPPIGHADLLVTPQHQASLAFGAHRSNCRPTASDTYHRCFLSCDESLPTV